VNRLPSGWVAGTLGDFAEPVRVGIDPASVPDLPYLGLEHVQAQTTNILGSALASSVRSTSYQFEPGATLFARLRPYLNKVCTPTFKGIGSGEFIIFPACTHLAPRFLKYLLNQPAFVEFTSTLDTGDRPRVNWRGIQEFPCALPPLAEQQRIVAAIEAQFSRLEAGAAALERANAKLARLRDAASLRAFELSKIGRQMTTLGAICERVTKGTTPTSIGHAYVDEGIGFVKVESLVSGAIDHAKCAHISAEAHADLARSQLQVGDLLVSIAGTLGRVGEVTEGDTPANTNQALAIVRLKDRTLGPYVKAWLESPKLRSAIRAGGKGVGMGNLTLKQIRDIPIVVPDAATRTSVLDRITSVNQGVTRTDDDIDRAVARRAGLRASILAAAFSGKLGSQDVKDEPASALLERFRQSTHGSTAVGPPRFPAIAVEGSRHG
jgi:type I restriction enzyme S subunit